jgi:hypothetical protein
VQEIPSTNSTIYSIVGILNSLRIVSVEQVNGELRSVCALEEQVADAFARMLLGRPATIQHRRQLGHGDRIPDLSPSSRPGEWRAVLSAVTQSAPLMVTF